MNGKHFNIRHLILRTTAVILFFNVCNLSAQSLTIPQDRNPAYTKVRPLYQQDTITIRFFGDIMMHSAQIQTADIGGNHDFSTYFELMKGYLSDSDLNVGNMEFTLAGEPYTGYPAFSAPDNFGGHLADNGFGLFLCANNHIFDKGRNGLIRTLGIYDDLAQRKGIHYTGAAADCETACLNNPLIINIKGIRIAFINATYGTNSPRGEGWPKTYTLNDKDGLAGAMETAESKADLTIVTAHWGTEYILKHSNSQEQEARWFAEKGADLIIGAHPHVIQDAGVIETAGRRVPVVYSLGNSVSNMSAENTQAGLMTTIRIIRHGNGDITTLEPEHRYTWCSRPGGYGNSYYVIPLTDYLGRKDEWTGGWDYDKMVSTYRKVSDITGIKENTK